MKIWTLCNTCLQPFEVTVLPGDERLIKELVGTDLACNCPRLCGGRMPIVILEEAISELAKSPQLRDPICINARELYKAVGGAGLPDEIAVDPVFVAALLKSEAPVEVVTEQQGRHVYLHELRFRNVTLHLCSGLRGAQVFKVTKEKAHAAVQEEAGRDRS